jgi:transcriptional regulator with XRE-family HTH domain
MRKGKNTYMKSTQLLEIGARLRESRIKLHLTQTKMAETLEMSLNYYGQIERGKKGLSLSKAILCRDKL